MMKKTRENRLFSLEMRKRKVHHLSGTPSFSRLGGHIAHGGWEVNASETHLG